MLSRSVMVKIKHLWTRSSHHGNGHGLQHGLQLLVRLAIELREFRNPWGQPRRQRSEWLRLWQPRPLLSPLQWLLKSRRLWILWSLVARPWPHAKGRKRHCLCIVAFRSKSMDSVDYPSSRYLIQTVVNYYYIIKWPIVCIHRFKFESIYQG